MAYFQKRGKGWTYVFNLEPDPATGKRRQKKVGGFKTKKEAQKAYEKMATSPDIHKTAVKQQWFMNEYLEHWLSQYKNKVARSTYTAAASKIRKRIIPAIGRIPLNKVQAHHFETFRDDMLEEFSAQYVHTLLSLLNRVFNHALKQKLISSNVLELVDRPKIKKRDYSIWTMEECRSFIRIVKEKYPDTAIAFILAINTGMRRSEILGLRWKDIDLDNHMIHVRHSLYHESSDVFFFEDVKTATSRRDIRLDTDTIKELKQHRAKQNEWRLKNREIFKEHGLLCTQQDGSPISPGWLGRCLRSTIKQHSLSPLRFHDFRHTHISTLLALGVNIKAIQERAGHSSITVTMDIYGHVLPDTQQAAIQSYEDAKKINKEKF